MSTLLQHAQIDWDDQGRPHSRQYDDVYFAVNEGIEETKHVFLGQTRLAERFANLAPHSCMVIGETGFGTGMNFFCAWQLFDQHAHSDGRLH
ncbi:MAG: bifunctional tRNA (5-methylaminomethyl-2-thiouridine)(34)-methyltransferase MnmD/FAD-dependent 5-carboxymethylaminomethyl-2-thiouridine(34) oxidoreductase MnmC, partial [Pseudomonas putida]